MTSRNDRVLFKGEFFMYSRMFFSLATGCLLFGLDVDARGEGPGEALYLSTCAACHGADGHGNQKVQVGFEQPIPDFTDCNFSTREPAPDWAGIGANGGPFRGFSPIMPAFGDALTEEQLFQIVEHIHAFCPDEEREKYPNGGIFNLPRPLWTAKAYVEDEAVLIVDSPISEEATTNTALVYEKRFGAANNFEIKLPWHDVWSEPNRHGFGDMALSVKRSIIRNDKTGSIVSLVGEVILPTGDEGSGFGNGFTVLEPFAAYGQLLPGDFFFQSQFGAEIPLKEDHEVELLYRGALGRTFIGSMGRAWSPMVGFLGANALEQGATPSFHVVPQLHVTLNTRQHIMLVMGAKVPVTDFSDEPVQARVTLLWDWFDGGFFEGWQK